MQRFKDNKTPQVAERALKACAFAPGSGIAADQLRALMDIAKPMETGENRDWYRIAAAFAEYRAGQWNDVRESLKEMSDTPMVRKVCADLVLAMVHQHLQEPAEARTKLEAARKLVSAHWPPKKAEQDGWWWDWLIAHLLLKEADGLLKTAVPGQ